jgi:hypothetical protein
LCVLSCSEANKIDFDFVSSKLLKKLENILDFHQILYVDAKIMQARMAEIVHTHTTDSRIDCNSIKKGGLV